MIQINIQYLNELIEACIAHGGDVGGAYYSNEEEVRHIMNRIAVNSGIVWAFDNFGAPIVLRYHRDDEAAGEAVGRVVGDKNDI